MPAGKPDQNTSKLDQLVAQTQKNREQRQQGYREQGAQALPVDLRTLHQRVHSLPLRELTVHHRDHNHDNNPSDGSNWELLCIYCHDNEHQRQLEAAAGTGATERPGSGTSHHQPFADLKSLLKKDH